MTIVRYQLDHTASSSSCLSVIQESGGGGCGGGVQGYTWDRAERTECESEDC